MIVRKLINAATAIEAASGSHASGLSIGTPQAAILTLDSAAGVGE
jgi:hypothetical protein